MPVIVLNSPSIVSFGRRGPLAHELIPFPFHQLPLLPILVSWAMRIGGLRRDSEGRLLIVYYQTVAAAEKLPGHLLPEPPSSS